MKNAPRFPCHESSQVHRILLLAGPTAAGKTDIAIQVALALNAEIISADSRQIYRELTIGTAKPDVSQLERVKHHFINEKSLGESYSAGTFAREAWARIGEIQARGRPVVVVGGSTLYVQALQYGIAAIPSIPKEVRTALTARLQAEGAASLYRELRRVDPSYAATLDATKSQRILRGLEVFHGTGRSLSSFFSSSESPPPGQFLPFVITRDRTILYERINQRVDSMIKEGLVEEVRELHNTGFSISINALRTIGYKEVFDFLKLKSTFDEMVELIKRNTRRYAKRQLTWYRSKPDFKWLNGNSIDEVVRELIFHCNNGIQAPEKPKSRL